MSDLSSQVGLVAMGWLLGLLSQGVERRRQNYLEKRRVLTRLDRILTTIAIELEVRGRLSGLSVDGVLTEPPKLPEDFDRVVDQLGDWEARRGNYIVHSQLIDLRSLVDLAKDVYSTLKDSNDTSGSLLGVYRSELKAVKDAVWRLIGIVQDARLSPLGWLKKRIRPNPKGWGREQLKVDGGS